jgi:metal-sulfur cluster biosynthetic enzyme
MTTTRAVLDELRSIQDPELGIGIVDLGLIYRIDIDGDAIAVDFTLTYPGCPAEEIIRRGIVEKLQRAFGTRRVTATVVWKPLWGPERMSEEARVGLGYPV